MTYCEITKTETFLKKAFGDPTREGSVIYSLVIKPTRCTNFSNLFWK
jgi:hypothetical protein